MFSPKRLSPSLVQQGWMAGYQWFSSVHLLSLTPESHLICSNIYKTNALNKTNKPQSATVSDEQRAPYVLLPCSSPLLLRVTSAGLWLHRINATLCAYVTTQSPHAVRWADAWWPLPPPLHPVHESAMCWDLLRIDSWLVLLNRALGLQQQLITFFCPRLSEKGGCGCVMGELTMWKTKKTNKKKIPCSLHPQWVVSWNFYYGGVVTFLLEQRPLVWKERMYSMDRLI